MKHALIGDIRYWMMLPLLCCNHAAFHYTCTGHAKNKSIPLNNFAIFSRTIKSYNKILHTCYSFSCPYIWKVSLHYLQNWQNYAALSRGNLAVETLSKIVSTIQDSANAVSANVFLSTDKCLECLPSPFTYSCQTTCETLDSLINWTCRKLSRIFSSVIFNSETVLGFGWSFQNSFVHSSQDKISPFHSNWRVIR